MIVIVGSGPAGIAAAHALADAGKEVAIMDVGKTLEPDLDKLRHKMALQDHRSWSDEDIKKIEGTRSSRKEAIHTKLSYGSSFATDTDPEISGIAWRYKNGFSISHARGGLSNIWGSAILPYRQEDIQDWPISIADLEPHYAAVMRFVPGVTYDDDLALLLPSRSNAPQNLELSRQGSVFFDHVNRHREQLRSKGIVVGKSRVAVDANGIFSGKSCTYCGLCLSGCPHQLIYSSSHSISSLIAKGVKYMPGHLVERFVSVNNVLKIQGKRIASGSSFSVDVDRIFLASGVLPTARIVLESLGLYDRPIYLKDSQYFIIPLLQFEKTTGIEKEDLHTLSQAFLEIDDPEISRGLIHLQLYGYSRFLKSELERTFLKYPLKHPKIRDAFLGRLLIAQGFLHSDESGQLELVLKKQSSITSGKLLVSHSRGFSTNVTIARVVGKLFASSLQLGCVPLVPGIKIPKPGNGYHSGGTFPMGKYASDFQTDILGRLHGFEKVHLVDASVLPSIPATSITLSIMANAHRIASWASRDI